MILERIKSAGISHNSYLIGSGNEAAVIDPRRDCQVYAHYARRKGLKIKYIFETHRNEDYVVGSLELQNITGAEIYHGPGLAWKYGITLTDGQSFRMGDIRLTAIHTPGHTDESMSYTLADLDTGPSAVAVFTGDTLFVGDVGRIDLYGEAAAPRLAANLYDSIFNKLLPLGDGTIIYPAHGGGSVCGAHIADREESTIGIERARNRALQGDKDAFVKYKVAEKLERPYYFSQMEKYNLEGPPLLGRLPSSNPLSTKEFKAEVEKGALVIDAREPAAFGGVHINGSYSIWLEGLPNFAGWVLPYDKPVVLVLEKQADLNEATRYLLRAGYDPLVKGYLKGGIESWYKAGLAIQSLDMLSVHQLRSALEKRNELTVLDVRGGGEWRSGHLAGATHIYVGNLEQRLSEVPKDKPVAVYCESGNRSGLAASIMLRAGYPKVYSVPGSIAAWKAAGFPVVKD